MGTRFIHKNGKVIPIHSDHGDQPQSSGEHAAPHPDISATSKASDQSAVTPAQAPSSQPIAATTPAAAPSPAPEKKKFGMKSSVC